VNTAVSDKVVRGLGLSIREKMVRRGRPLYVKIWSKLAHLKNADFQSIFARSASSVTPSEKVQLIL